ncbi:MAG: hypothetical protein K6G22_14245 [Lachnospiraceae bacterium]|nr:hypothetical protein [Lachnospiraceae bacterium]
MPNLASNTEVRELQRDLLSLDLKDEDARIDLNKRLIKRYPFLEIKGWISSEPSDFKSTFLDCMPVGWRKSLGIPLCEELRKEILRIDSSLLNTYRVYQVKEKFGTLRWYADSYSDQMKDIRTKYEDISRYTCIVCGKINVPIFNDGYISPFCIECYKSHRGRMWGTNLEDKKIESLIMEKPNLTRDTIVEISNSKGTVKRRIDFSDTLQALGVNPDSLPTIEKIIEARKEREEGQD